MITLYAHNDDGCVYGCVYGPLSPSAILPQPCVVAAVEEAKEEVRAAVVAYLNREALRLYQFADDATQHPDSRRECREMANHYGFAAEEIRSLLAPAAPGKAT